ncbi:MAG: phosphonate metabolism transcriptional regulator PhnF [Hyphomicrobiaceae bacterium]|nr:phosphonate metabolism transcriptional regulator PhnF [Hyphomicrobiaceae bacterium]
MTKKVSRRSTQSTPKSEAQGKRRRAPAKKTLSEAVSRGSGVALWRQIAEDIETEITVGRLAPGTRLPTEAELAQRYEVNRHTLRRALAELSRKGMIEAFPRRGTFVSKPRIPYPIGRQTRFSENMLKVGREPGGRPIAITMGVAPAEMAEWLGIAQATECVEIKHVRVANDVPICLSTLWLPADRFRRIGAIYDRLRSVTKSLARLGVTHYERKRTRVTSRPATNEEREFLELARGATILVVDSLDVDGQGEPISAGQACFAADRVELLIEN